MFIEPDDYYSMDLDPPTCYTQDDVCHSLHSRTEFKLGIPGQKEPKVVLALRPAALESCLPRV